jgi:hypothetical protein
MVLLNPAIRDPTFPLRHNAALQHGVSRLLIKMRRRGRQHESMCSPNSAGASQSGAGTRFIYTDF